MSNDPYNLIKELKEKTEKINSLEGKNTVLEDKNTVLEDKNTVLEQENRLLRKALFGPKSERYINDENQLELELDISPVKKEKAEQEKIEYERVKKRKGLKLERFTYPDDLPVEEVKLGDLSKSRFCEKTGEAMVLIRTEKSDKLAIRPSQYYIRREIRGVYAYSKNPLKGVYTEPVPDMPIRNCRADASLLAHVLIEKFYFYLTCYRLEEKFKLDNVHIQRQTMYGWIKQLGNQLEIIYQEMLRRIIQSERMFTDATSLCYLTKNELKGSKDGYVYVYIGGSKTAKIPPYVCYQFAESKQEIHTKKI